MYFGSMLTLLPAVVGDSVGWSLKARLLVTLPAVLAWLCLAVRPLMDADSDGGTNAQTQHGEQFSVSRTLEID